jgi:hypothetical protein
LATSFDARFAKERARRIGEVRGHQWTLREPDLKAVLEELEKVRPLPIAAHAGCAAAVHVTWDLLLFDAQTGDALPHQDADHYLHFDTGSGQILGTSTLYCRAAERSSAHLFLSLPFDDVTAAAREQIDAIERAFPVPLSPKHWKLWRLTKARNGYTGRRLLLNA